MSDSSPRARIAWLALGSGGIVATWAVATSSGFWEVCAATSAALLVGWLAGMSAVSHPRGAWVIALLTSLCAGECARHGVALAHRAHHRWHVYTRPVDYAQNTRAHEVAWHRFLSRCASEELPDGGIFVVTDWFPTPDFQFWFYPRNLHEDQSLICGVRADDPVRIARSLQPNAAEEVIEAYAPQIVPMIQSMFGDVFREEYLAIILPKVDILIGMNTTYDLRRTPGFEVVLDLGPGFYLMRRKSPGRG